MMIYNFLLPLPRTIDVSLHSWSIVLRLAIGVCRTQDTGNNSCVERERERADKALPKSGYLIQICTST